MARHRNINRMDLSEELDDYGSSYGASYDSEPCVSPGTADRYTYKDKNSKLSDHFGRRRQDSVQEEDEPIDVDDDARAPNGMQDDDELIFKTEINVGSETDQVSSKLNLKNQSTHEMEEPLPLSQESAELERLTISSDEIDIQDEESSAGAQSLNLLNIFEPKPQQHRDNVLYEPLIEHLKKYHSSQDYWFDFSTNPSRFPLSAKVKGKIPTPVNEIDSNSLTSKVGQHLYLGPSLTNVIPDSRTPQALAAAADPIASHSKPALSVSVATLRTQSPSSRDGSRRSSPAPRMKETKSAINLEAVMNEYTARESSSKPSINLVVIGHVDAGKSTLMGRLLVDLGLISQKVMHRNETDSKKTGKSSFLYAWVLDETEEERSRGITMDVASSRFETENRKIVILDAPGHKDFIPNMITGAAQADAALLVIDATKGEFEAGFDAGGQTREHAMLVRSLGVSQIAVVVNKLDNVNWSQERFDDIKSKIKTFLKQTGFKESDVAFVPCSGLKGENLIKPSLDQQLCSWYKGPCLLEVIDSFKPPDRLIAKPFRLSIADIFKGNVAGISISGRIEAGSATVGSKMVVMPASEACTIKAIAIDDEPVQQAFAGDNVTMVLLGADASKVTIGSVVCDVNFPCPMVTKFEARVVVFNSIETPITRGLPIAIHYNNASEQGVVKKIICSLNKSTAEVVKKNPRFLTRNSSGLLVIEVTRPICLELYKDYKDLGRFMMRVDGNTIAAGLVTKLM